MSLAEVLARFRFSEVLRGGDGGGGFGFDLVVV